MSFKDILNKFRLTSFTEKEKGTRFERLMKRWLLSDPRFNTLKYVWMWDEFPGRKDFGGSDTGIDLVAKTEDGDYWAIQCKCYQESATIDKPAVDSFIATSGKSFVDSETLQTVAFSHRLWISTTNKWGVHAEETIHNQTPPVNRIGLKDLEDSPVDWKKLLEGSEGKDAMLPGKQLRKHQLEAISKAREYYKDHDRGKLIMACGTGKTFTSLRMAEDLLDGKGLVLFMVPSIALLGQSLNAWMADAKKPIKAVCICSDNKVQKNTNESDDLETSIVDLALPASTNTITIARQLNTYRKHDGLTVVFSTYQSVDAISAAQKRVLSDTNGTYGVFDLIICDEAHRTTGIIFDENDESAFTKIHNDDNVQGRKRLYMTATPRLYGSSAKVKASQKDCILCSMDDKSIYGEEIHRVNFSYAVANGLLTDYKVFVLTVGEDEMPKNILARITDENQTEYNFDDTSKLVGVINGLSKILRGDQGKTAESDPGIMRRAVAFCNATGKRGKSKDKPGSSVVVAKTMPIVSRMLDENLNEVDYKRVASISCKHIDGSMNSQERNGIMQWLKEDSDNPRECRIVTNVRCLSEGVDVPALDAVLFLAARNSQVDVVQSVGRVMRNFKGKKYGYIIIPIVTPAGVKAEDALNNSKTFEVVWQILNALRSHDDSFNAEVNKIALNKAQSSKVIVGGMGIGMASEPDPEYGSGDSPKHITNKEVARQLELQFEGYQSGIYAKLVEKCGDRFYWENWAKDIAVIATKFIERISRLVSKGGRYEAPFTEFLNGLQKNINPSVDTGQAVEMLAQHMICRPVFDALFENYEFVKNNAVSISMQNMLDILHEEAFEKDTALLDAFYQSVKMNVGEIDNLEGKQTIIKNLYEQFFKGAFPKTVDRLGIVYTPVECVDFIIHSVDDILKREFETSLTDENVHILDPFTGTGTFITRLLQSGCIKPEDLERKYRNEIHCNELVLLAYYVADINIESVFHDLTKRKEYLPYDGICLTDTFQTTEGQEYTLGDSYFNENIERIKKSNKTPLKVIIGNPPYSAGQKSANDNAQNLSYPHLDERIASSYVHNSTATLKNSTYDTYIKAFRWSSDRLAKDEGGVIAFISNGGWLDGNAQDGFRQCIEQEFTDIYVLNLRGNQRTSGELSRKEGGKIFGSGSRTPITITLLVKNPSKMKPKDNKAHIHYHDIGDYLSREDKLALVKGFGSISSDLIKWIDIEPNEKNDWINQRGGVFDEFPLLSDKKDKNTIFNIDSCGLKTNRDTWCYNSSKKELCDNINNAIAFYNSEVDRYKDLLLSQDEVDVLSFINTDSTKFSWDRAQKENDLPKFRKYALTEDSFYTAMYRPFFKQNCYMNRQLNNCVYKQPKLFPTPKDKNLCICSCGIGAKKDFSCIIVNIVQDFQLNFNGNSFPLYFYEEIKQEQLTLFDDPAQGKYRKKDGITDWILKEMRHRYATRNIDKEMIFYYVYGLLHSEEYRREFEADLKKSLPRIPIVEKLEDFLAFSKAGKKLADLHLNYEEVEPHDAVEVVGDNGNYVVEKMRFAKMDGKDKNGKAKKVDDKSIIIYNEHIRVENIPAKAYEYVVNGKSAIEWIMERYAVTIDKKSGIKNDPNDWSREHNKPRYILDLLLSIINVSCKTVDIVKTLPHLDCCLGSGQEEKEEEDNEPSVSKSDGQTVINQTNYYVSGDVIRNGGVKIVK